jgi:hypothetical protein
MGMGGGGIFPIVGMVTGKSYPMIRTRCHPCSVANKLENYRCTTTMLPVVTASTLLP